MTRDFSTWSTSNNITIDYGVVTSLEDDNVSYPILIIIAADPKVTVQTSVACSLTVGQETETLDFIITPAGPAVSM
jgi:hypothetical protein